MAGLAREVMVMAYRDRQLIKSYSTCLSRRVLSFHIELLSMGLIPKTQNDTDKQPTIVTILLAMEPICSGPHLGDPMAALQERIHTSHSHFSG